MRDSLSPRMSARAAWIVLAVVGAAFVAHHIALIFHDRINWDEFLLLQRAEVAVKLGRIEGGGRPGLGVIALIPFVSGCSDPIDTINVVRLVWSVFTFALLAGTFALLQRAGRPSTHATPAAALGTACVAFVPVFVHWSVQVRTDQPAVACALWGGVALLASRDRPRLAAAAGLLVGVGYLFSQKAVYVAALCGLVALGHLWVNGGVHLAREARRCGWALVGALVAVLAYNLLVPLFWVPATATSLERGLDTFAYYRKLLGYRVYRSMVPTLYPQILLGLAIVVATVLAYIRKLDERKRLLVALAIAAAGLGVGWFHAAAFPYFWMTLGLFVSVSIGLAWPSVATILGRPSQVLLLVVGCWLAYIAVPYARSLLDQTQAPQRDSFAFIERSFPTTTPGFHADGGMFCRADPHPFHGYIRQNILSDFTGPGSEPRVAAFIDEFRKRPVSFVVTNALELFPAEIQRFWSEHYVPYFAAVAVAGWSIAPGDTRSIDVIVPGRYRWRGAGSLHVGTATVLPAADVVLLRGTVQVHNMGTAPGMLTLAVRDEPHPSPGLFHSPLQIAELRGLVRW